MFELFNVSYDELITGRSNELYQLRKGTFRDRLQWDVTCTNGMEHDEFDNPDTQYILGVYEDQIICSVRFVTLDKPNMITRTFSHLFHDVDLPLHLTESSRFFVDKERARQLLGEAYPVSSALFLSMINYGREQQYDAIYTIVSRAMLAILKRTGWKITVIKEAFLRPDEPIYLLTLPTDTESQRLMAQRTGKPLNMMPQALFNWPFTLPVPVTDQIR